MRGWQWLFLTPLVCVLRLILLRSHTGDIYDIYFHSLKIKIHVMYELLEHVCALIKEGTNVLLTRLGIFKYKPPKLKE